MLMDVNLQASCWFCWLDSVTVYLAKLQTVVLLISAIHPSAALFFYRAWRPAPRQRWANCYSAHSQLTQTQKINAHGHLFDVSESNLIKWLSLSCSGSNSRGNWNSGRTQRLRPHNCVCCNPLLWFTFPNSIKCLGCEICSSWKFVSLVDEKSGNRWVLARALQNTLFRLETY